MRKSKKVLCKLCPTELKLDTMRCTEKGLLCVPCTIREFGHNKKLMKFFQLA